MSQITTIINHYDSPDPKKPENIVYEFQDDLGRSYSLDFHPSEVITHYNSITRLSELEERELEAWQMAPLTYSEKALPPHVKKFIQASFMQWVEKVEIENEN